jgi:hypothetical protein
LASYRNLEILDYFDDLFKGSSYDENAFFGWKYENNR